MSKPAPLWRPSRERIESSHLRRFMVEAERRWNVKLLDFAALHRWSVERPEEFWVSVWDFCDIVAETRGARTLVDGAAMPGARFFPDARLNFAENLLRHGGSEDAIVFRGEDQVRRRVSRDQLRDLVSRLVQAMQAMGIGEGDRVAGFVANMPEAVAGLLAASSLGAIWSSCSPDFGVRGVVDRFGQIAPKLLLFVEGYFYNGKMIDTLPRLPEILAAIPSIERAVVIPYARDEPPISGIAKSTTWDDFLSPHAAGPIDFRAVALRSSAGDPLFLGHHRRAQMHRPWRRRHADPASQGASAPLRHTRGRPRLLFHHLRLDDVELASVGAGLGRHAAAL